jgi:hypothetical protein
MGSFDLSNENKCKTSPKFLLNQTRCLLQKSQRIFLIVASAFPSISEMIIARLSSETKIRSFSCG